MTKNKKIAFAGTGMAVTAAMLIPSAFAGTGGSDFNGIDYGQSSLYCDSSLESIVKTDANSGQVLEGAAFSVTATPDAAVKGYTTAELEANLPAEDKALWVYTFNNAIDTAFSETDFAETYLAAQISMTPGENQTGDSDQGGVWGDDPGAQVVGDGGGTTYTPDEVVVYPADITGLGAANDSVKSAALTSWVTAPAKVAGPGADNTLGTADDTLPTASVSEFFTATKSRLDALGAVLYTNYDPNAPMSSTTAPDTLIANTASEVPALAEYTKQLEEFNQLLAAVRAAGYTDVSYSGTTVTFGAVDTAAQDWDAFVEAYDYVTTGENWSFGLLPPKYDLVAKVAGNDAVTDANADAHAAVNAEVTDSITSESDGKAYFQTFGRAQAVGTDSPPTGCEHLTVTIQETEAPEGYILDPESQDTAPSNLDPYATGVEAANTALVFTNTLDAPGVPGPDPESPVFESGL